MPFLTPQTNPQAKEEGEGEVKGDEVEVTPLSSSAWSDSTSKPVGKWNHLDNFWKKYNKVLLDALAIEKEEEKVREWEERKTSE